MLSLNRELDSNVPHFKMRIFKMRTFSVQGGGGAQPHSIAFGGVFPNITEAILVDEICTKVRIYSPKVVT